VSAEPNFSAGERSFSRQPGRSGDAGARVVYNGAVDDLKWDAQGLITAVAQDRLTGQVRMVAWMNREALQATLDSGQATFFSRSRAALWRKGETSGHVLRVLEVVADCDGDTLLLLVDPEGPSCHTGRGTCFFRRVSKGAALEDQQDAMPFLLSLEEEIRQRASSTAAKSYTRSLLDAGLPHIGGKITEEAGELSRALQSETDDRVISETADVLYHALVGLRARGLDWRRVIEALAARAGRSGHVEKASRGKT
jgi:phosphoribosyl-AMP cyclohydrolase / phosphoribosyl-ATP pyrophosphohydrolase